MYTNLINPNFQSYASNQINFRGTIDPIEPAEKLQRILRDLYREAKFDGNSSAGFARACEAKRRIVALLNECGATDIAKKLEKAVIDDSSSGY